MDSSLYIKSGFPYFDAYYGGFERGMITLVCGYPQSGKTALAAALTNNMMLSPNRKHANKLLYFTCKDSVKDIARRIYFLSVQKALPPKGEGSDLKVPCMEWFWERGIYIEDSLPNFANMLINRNEAPAVTIIDNLQELCLDKGLEHERNYTLTMRILQALAEQSKSAVIILSDNKSVHGSRFGKRPLPTGCDHTYTLNKHIGMLCYLRRPEYFAFASDTHARDWRILELFVSNPASSKQERFLIEIHNDLFTMVEKEHFNPNNMLKNSFVKDIMQKLHLEVE